MCASPLSDTLSGTLVQLVKPAELADLDWPFLCFPPLPYNLDLHGAAGTSRGGDVLPQFTLLSTTTPQLYAPDWLLHRSTLLVRLKLVNNEQTKP